MPDERDFTPRVGLGHTADWEEWEALGSDESVMSPDDTDPDYGFQHYSYDGGPESSDDGSESESESESDSESESGWDGDLESGSDSGAGPGPDAGAGASSGNRGAARGMMVEGCKAPTTVPRIALHRGTEQVRVRHYRTRDVAKYRVYQRAQRKKRAARDAKKTAKAEKMARKLVKEEKKQLDRAAWKCAEEARRGSVDRERKESYMWAGERKERDIEAWKLAKKSWKGVVERERVEKERKEAMERLKSR